MPAPIVPDWDEVRDLASRVKQGEALTLTAPVIALLRRSAREVAIDASEAAAALTHPTRAKALLRKIRERIRTGSNRSVDALHRMYQLRDAGDLEGARQQMRDVLAVEVVPFYRWIAEGQLEQLDDWKPPKGKTPASKAAPTGRVPASKAPPARKAPARKAPARKAPAENRRKTGKRS